MSPTLHLRIVHYGTVSLVPYSFLPFSGDDIVRRPRHLIHSNICFHVLGKKTEKGGAMTYAHWEMNVPLSIQVWEQGARASNGVWAEQVGDRRAFSILVTP
ncbi:hypothetical protein PISMIDRAFT_571933 [Pisolithus microcarpus 441]|uniref:Uncharacterized protein n=1 Tax=Pisolithus microcarpus 441 TaxID=765257 RepID=A0A0C9Z430_9AGAM|nr:hypothetical protein PISMIDRAFT_571933 [Pisolithus microcarpus 441]